MKRFVVKQGRSDPQRPFEIVFDDQVHCAVADPVFAFSYARRLNRSTFFLRLWRHFFPVEIAHEDERQAKFRRMREICEKHKDGLRSA